MTLAAGKTLGPYEITGLIGLGGMGEVYAARDPRLHREVAIKVLPAQFSSDPDRLRRFEQEARAAGMLNHPNILAIYDIGSQDDAIYVVSELLQGETLRQRIGGSPLPQRKAIDFAQQVAAGLAAAHEKGIVHRDLKPENIFITQDGRVKILDFGLAKLTEPAPAATEKSSLTTMDPGTEPGIVLGTIGYMSPEQVRGREADARADIFTFGVILYEMLTGKRAFHRDSKADTLSAILKEDPPEISQTNPGVSPSLERIVSHCMEKSPQERFQSARDLAFDLEMISGVSATSATAMAAEKGYKRRVPVRMIALLLLIGAITSIAGYYLGKTRSTSITTQNETQVQRLTFRRGFIHSARFAPDGHSVIYSAEWNGNAPELFSTRPESPESRSLGLTEVVLLSISSRGEMAVLLNSSYTNGWERTGTLATMAIEGGAPRPLHENVQDADWHPKERQLALARRVNDLSQIEFPIGKVLFKKEGWLGHIRFSPDGESIAFLDHPLPGDNRGFISMTDLAGKNKRLTREFGSITGLGWSKDGKEIWFTASEPSKPRVLYGVDLQGETRKIETMAGSYTLHDISSRGDLLLTLEDYRRQIFGVTPGETRERDLSWFDWSHARDLSPDGHILLFDEEGQGAGPNNSVYVRKTDGSPAVHLGEGYGVSISPDGNWVISALPTNPPQFRILPTGPGTPKPLNIPGYNLEFFGPSRWFADGKRILVVGYPPGKPRRYLIYDMEKSKATPIGPDNVWDIAFLSPDERHVLIRVKEKLMLYPLDGGEPIPLTNFSSTDFPIGWTADGQSLYIIDSRSTENKIYLADVKTGQRTLWKQIVPPDPAGMLGISATFISRDGKSYVYTFRRILSDLYLIQGL